MHIQEEFQRRDYDFMLMWLYSLLRHSFLQIHYHLKKKNPSVKSFFKEYYYIHRIQTQVGRSFALDGRRSINLERRVTNNGKRKFLDTRNCTELRRGQQNVWIVEQKGGSLKVYGLRKSLLIINFAIETLLTGKENERDNQYSIIGKLPTTVVDTRRMRGFLTEQVNSFRANYFHA